MRHTYKPPTEKQAAEFNAKVLDIVTEYPSGPTGNTRCSHKIETPLGWLEVSPGGDSVFTRFEEPKRAAKYFDCNPYSGKWNFHGETALSDFRMALALLMNNAPTI